MVPPAGLEPAALCLASSIRLSLTARQSWGCWLDYILDVSVPTRIVSEDPPPTASRFPADYPILAGFYYDLSRRSTGGSQGVPAYRVVHLMGSQLFPIKAPTRQMLYPLSYRGINSMAARMLTPVVDLVNHSTR